MLRLGTLVLRPTAGAFAAMATVTAQRWQSSKWTGQQQQQQPGPSSYQLIVLSEAQLIDEIWKLTSIPLPIGELFAPSPTSKKA